jgi:hypothetical protein
MNLCVAVYAALDMESSVHLGRIGTHPVEGHFGVVRAALRGVSQWRTWLSAEVFASIIPEFRDRLGLRARPRRGRTHRMVPSCHRKQSCGAFSARYE